VTGIPDRILYHTIRLGDWARQAACKDHDPTWWTADQVEFAADAEARGNTRRAKAICWRCPVRPDCLAHGSSHGEWGIWGGLSRAERGHRHKQMGETA
jgi:WhiB family transcriptional regulator, redox-sensing transcriptional regulator